MQNEATHTENVFVYGTLRRGEYNHRFLSQIGAVFLSTAQIRGKVFPTILGLPCLMEGFGLVEGEIYAVDEDGLDDLDSFEGHPDFYTRREVETVSGMIVWVYYGNSVQEGIIEE